MAKERLHKVLAACGVGSRRACEEMIAEGRISVDGEVVTQPGTQVDARAQDIRADGARVRPRPLQYWLLNKPRGVICSARAEGGKRRAVDLVPRTRERLFTVGRLDVESEGAIILTNDGELTHLVTHPRFEIEKTYRVEVEGSPDAAALAKLRKGMWLSEGRTGPVAVRVRRRTRSRTALEVTLNEGKRREIRRLFARIGHEVLRLVRTSIGPVKLGRLPSGRARVLRPDEIEALRDSARTVIRLGESRPAGRRRRKPGRRRRQS